jgi:hypothetical protein
MGKFVLIYIIMWWHGWWEAKMGRQKWSIRKIRLGLNINVVLIILIMDLYIAIIIINNIIILPLHYYVLYIVIIHTYTHYLTFSSNLKFHSSYIQISLLHPPLFTINTRILTNLHIHSLITILNILILFHPFSK